MSPQATNSLSLYKGQDPSKIEMLLKMQKKTVVNELMQHFCASSLKELAVKLSINR